MVGSCVSTAMGGGAGGGTGGGGGGADAGQPDAGASDAGDVDGGGDGGADGGVDAGSGFSITSLDSSARGLEALAVAFDPAQRRVGVVYFSPAGTEVNPGHPDYDVKYVEWRDGVVQPVEKLRVVQRRVGLAIAFDPVSGEPTVSYLGGAPGFVAGQPVYWFQSDAIVNRRSNGAWTETVVAASGDVVTCGNPLSDRGFLVGLWPALAYDATGRLYFAYRDGHDGQFPQQDWASSDVEVFDGVWPNLTGRCVSPGGNTKQAPGGHLQLVMAGAQPVLTYDRMFGSADGQGTDVLFHELLAGGGWTGPATLLADSNTQSGASLAWDSQEGVGVAALDRTTDELVYLHRPPGGSWSPPVVVQGAGSGGWYPSLAMDPAYHEPAVAYYVCSPRVAVNELSCLTSEDELRVAQRVAGTWRSTLVDPAGGYLPKVGFVLSGTAPVVTSKRVVVYRQPAALDSSGLPVANAGELKIAVER